MPFGESSGEIGGFSPPQYATQRSLPRSAESQSARGSTMASDKTPDSASACEKTDANDKAVAETVTVPSGDSFSVLPGPPVPPDKQKEIAEQGDDPMPLESAAPSKRKAEGHIDEEE